MSAEDQLSTEVDDLCATPPHGIPMQGYPIDRLEGGPEWGIEWAGPEIAVDPGLAPDLLSPGPEPALGPGWRPGSRAGRFLASFSLAGLAGALIFYCLSLTPSLLPRVWYLQAAMSGVTMAIGYAVGLFAGWLARSLIPWHGGPRVRRATARALAVTGLVLVPLFGVLGARWEHQVRAAAGAGQPSEARYVLVVIATLLIALALIMAARALRWIVLLAARPLGRVISPKAATALCVLVVCALAGFLLTGAASRLAIGAANSVYAGVDSGTAAGVTQPMAAQRSGSPASLVPWPTLGRQGRSFVAGGPTVRQISAFTGRPAMEPIRVYVGLKSADSIAAESALAVRELTRTGAFDRKVIVVATPAGSGWLNPAMIDPLEYMYDGDTAVAAIQYSYLPSWLSSIVDKVPAQEAGRDLFDAVYAQWRRLPAGRRPRLVVFGEGLGSFGGESAFSGVDDIRDRTSGVLWVGPTSSNTLWSQFTAGRDQGTPEWAPVYQGGHAVRFAAAPAVLIAAKPGWGQPRVVYLQNPSDPTLWWSWSLAFHRPQWLSASVPPGVSRALHWYPLLTFCQVTADLAVGAAVPPGHGHSYGMPQAAAAWAAIIPPAGWTAERTMALGRVRAS